MLQVPEPLAQMVTILGSSAVASILTGTLILLVVVAWMMGRALPFGRHGVNVWHPECPGTRIYVVRGFWQRCWRDEDWATLDEVAEYHRWHNRMAP